MEDALRIVALSNAAYYLLTGVWPLVHMRSFLAVTGPKHDLWLVRAVGVLVTVIGATILLAAWEQRLTLPIMVLAVASAAGLTAIDVVYVAKRVISKVYLLDAAAEVLLIGLWLAFWRFASGAAGG